MSAFTSRYLCISCRGYLTFDQKMDSHGVCPKCGYTDESCVTVCRTYQEVGCWRGRWIWRRWFPERITEESA